MGLQGAGPALRQRQEEEPDAAWHRGGVWRVGWCCAVWCPEVRSMLAARCHLYLAGRTVSTQPVTNVTIHRKYSLFLVGYLQLRIPIKHLGGKIRIHVNTFVTRSNVGRVFQIKNNIGNFDHFLKFFLSLKLSVHFLCGATSTFLY